MAAYATVDDLSAFWKPVTDTARAELLLGFASGIVRKRCAGEPDADVAKWVVCDMVKAAMLYEDYPAVSQATASAGGYSSSMTFANPTGDLYWKGQYSDALGLKGVSFGSISPARGTE
jgi:hypothetical protein